MLSILEGTRIKKFDLLPEDFFFPVTLSEPLSSYFDTDGDAFTISLSSLVLSRARLDSLESAVARMSSASKGKMPKRAPISVRSYRDMYLVEDGNTTSIALYLSGYSNIIAKLKLSKKDG